jgi:hypothetical protein
MVSQKHLCCSAVGGRARDASILGMVAVGSELEQLGDCVRIDWLGG